MIVECSFEWNAGYSEEVLPFTNNIPQKDGGTHLLGFRSALTRVINKYSNDRNSKKNKITLSGEDIKEGLSTFLGVKRRFEVHIDTAKTTFIDDYAHHPKEINALIKAIKEFYPARRIVGIFQPHLFSRTRDFMDEFANVLSKMDKVILLPIYPARELPIEDVNSEFLLDKIKHDNKVLINEQEKIFECILDELPKVVVTIGAGDIDLLVPKLKNYLLENA